MTGPQGVRAAGAASEARSDPPVILVDADDVDLGDAGKLEAHERGALHRAVSVFAFDREGQLLLQRRAREKYHSGGLWSNSACTHPRRGESLEDAARRCVREELGVECAELTRRFSFIYRAQVSPSLVEHELDHVFVATVDDAPSPDESEVEAWRLVDVREVALEAAASPSTFSAWFPIALALLEETGNTRDPALGEKARDTRSSATRGS